MTDSQNLFFILCILFTSSYGFIVVRNFTIPRQDGLSSGFIDPPLGTSPLADSGFPWTTTDGPPKEDFKIGFFDSVEFSSILSPGLVDVFPEIYSPISPDVSVSPEDFFPPDLLVPSTGDAALDVYFLADNTGSMGGEIGKVQRNARCIFEQISARTTLNIRFGVGAYRDFGDEFVFANFLSLTAADPGDEIIAAVNSWRAFGGGDTPEAQIFALHEIATNFYQQIGWREDSVKIIVWFGDAPGHDPSGGITEEIAIKALQEKDIRVNSIDVVDLDSSGQATRISQQTGGTYVFQNRSLREANNFCGGDEEYFVEYPYYYSRFSTTFGSVTTGGESTTPSEGSFVDAIISSVDYTFGG